VNRLSEQIGRGVILPVDTRRRLLERRIESAKDRLAGDVSHLGALVRGLETRARRGIGLAVVAAGVLLAVGLVARFVARRRRMLRVTWR
jgi:hypothetical protein